MRSAAPLRLAAAGLMFSSAITLLDVDALAVSARPNARIARRVKKHHSLTGMWSGAYRYPWSHSDAEAVPFNARIEETGENITGEIDEPNTYADPSAPRLYAAIVGARTGLDVRFTKQMDGTGGAAHAIFYDGAADSELSRIDGRWRLRDGFSGTFFMERADAGAAVAASRAASATG
jgi:hypothetical protein